MSRGDEPSSLPDGHPLNGFASRSRLVRAYRGERPETTPVWFMRQAGRSLPEYRELRLGTSMLDACLDPELASEITVQPVRRHGVDAGIFFSDIVVPLRLAGIDVSIVPGRGPVFAEPLRDAAAIDTAAARSRETLADEDATAATFAPITAAIGATVDKLAAIGDGGTPLIGFCGAPFTLAAYLVEGGPSKDHLRARTLMHADPAAWRALMEWCADLSGAFLRAQVLAGASAAQLFDSWAGSLNVADYRASVLPYSLRALSWVRDLRDSAGRSVPLVHFGVGTSELLVDMAREVDVIGIDDRLSLADGIARIDAAFGPGARTVQGNLQPAMLGAPWPVLERHVDGVLREGLGARAHVLNLGHGVPPETDPAVLTRIVEHAHAWRGAEGEPGSPTNEPAATPAQLDATPARPEAASTHNADLRGGESA